MAFMNLKFYSEALGMQTEVYVVIPQRSTAGEIGVETNAKAERYKCLYLLHGLSDDHSIWLRRTSIERYASEYGICVVMPAAARSFYTDMKYGQKYYTYIAKELPKIIREFLNVSDKREDNFVAGASMGGYGCMAVGLTYPETFSKIASIAAAACYIICYFMCTERVKITEEAKSVSFKDTLKALAGIDLRVWPYPVDAQMIIDGIMELEAYNASMRS